MLRGCLLNRDISTRWQTASRSRLQCRTLYLHPGPQDSFVFQPPDKKFLRSWRRFASYAPYTHIPPFPLSPPSLAAARPPQETADSPRIHSKPDPLSQRPLTSADRLPPQHSKNSATVLKRAGTSFNHPPSHTASSAPYTPMVRFLYGQSIGCRSMSNSSKLRVP
uniref:Uncharacterized protein n=1 Tax=Nannochloropsis gaditana (strain CCMP526) TaxID=1093141 RepID=I2CPA9_NANGC